MAGQVSLQADIGNASSSTLGLLGAAQPLLKALSADNVSPLAVLQVEAIGNCFLSNGEWADKLPDLLTRASSMRLERLAAWVGWQKGDTASYLSQTSGGRSAALICLFLTNFYPSERCGLVLHNISSSIIPKDQQNASVAQLGNVSACIAGKISCLGFGNFFALQLTRIRQSFFEAGHRVPTNLASVPTEETMGDFLVMLHKALTTEDLILRFSGSRGAGPLLAAVMSLCPDDVRVDVQGELVLQGQRVSVLFSIDEGETETSYFHLESRLRTHSEDFSRRFIDIVDKQSAVRHLKFLWPGWLSSCLSIALIQAGAPTATGEEAIRQALADLIGAAILTLNGQDFEYRSFEPEKSMPSAGFRAWLGPNYRHRVFEKLELVLTGPLNIDEPDLMQTYVKLKGSIQSNVASNICSCPNCFKKESWINLIAPPRGNTTASKRLASCKYASLWNALGDIVGYGALSLLVRLEGNPAIELGPSTISKALLVAILTKIEKNDDGEQAFFQTVTPEVIHRGILSIVSASYASQGVCTSSEAAAAFPATLQYPSIQYPWTVDYILAEGRLHDRTGTYFAIVDRNSETRDWKKWRRPKAQKTISKVKGQSIPSNLGEYYSFTMSLQPGSEALYLRSIIQLSVTQNLEVQFRDIHLGFMNLSRAAGCEHYQRTPVDDKEVLMTSVAAPLAKKTYTAVTLTHWNPEAQFLCCVGGSRSLYHIGCCLPCAIAQARSEKIPLVIGGAC